jgi:hypothetical protein
MAMDKRCGRPCRNTFSVLPVGDRLDARNLSCGEPANHDGPHRATIEWER